MADYQKLFDGLETGLKTVTALAEAGEVLGLPDQVADALKIATVLVESAQNVMLLIESGKVVATDGDKARIVAILADIRRANDALAAKIADS